MEIINKNGTINYRTISKMKKPEILKFLSGLDVEELQKLYEAGKKSKRDNSFSTGVATACSLFCAYGDAYSIVHSIKEGSLNKDLIFIILTGLIVCGLLAKTAIEANELTLTSKSVKITRQYLLENYPQLFKEKEKKKNNQKH